MAYAPQVKRYWWYDKGRTARRVFFLLLAGHAPLSVTRSFISTDQSYTKSRLDR
jgi:hypothetical protein